MSNELKTPSNLERMVCEAYDRGLDAVDISEYYGISTEVANAIIIGYLAGEYEDVEL